MSHVKKIGDIINSFITGESVNRKRPRDEVGEKEAKRSKSSHSLDKTAFMSRVSSYNCPGWGGRKVGPLLLARHGWEALQDQQLMVRCTSCQVTVVNKLNFSSFWTNFQVFGHNFKFLETFSSF